MKRELKWTFEIMEIPALDTPVEIYACSTLGFANCYFTRPLYDSSADVESPKEESGTPE